jgi:hypothetical protein
LFPPPDISILETFPAIVKTEINLYFMSWVIYINEVFLQNPRCQSLHLSYFLLSDESSYNLLAPVVYTGLG